MEGVETAVFSLHYAGRDARRELFPENTQRVKAIRRIRVDGSSERADTCKSDKD